MEKSLKSQKKFYERRRRREIAKRTSRKIMIFLKNFIRWTSVGTALVLACSMLCRMVATVAVKQLIIFIVSVIWILLFLKANEGGVKKDDLRR